MRYPAKEEQKASSRNSPVLFLSRACCHFGLNAVHSSTALLGGIYFTFCTVRFMRDRRRSAGTTCQKHHHPSKYRREEEQQQDRRLENHFACDGRFIAVHTQEGVSLFGLWQYSVSSIYGRSPNRREWANQHHTTSIGAEHKTRPPIFNAHKVF